MASPQVTKNGILTLKTTIKRPGHGKLSQQDQKWHSYLENDNKTSWHGKLSQQDQKWHL